jgi:CubicO group peptidase (beta-lactamase class C family)
VHQEKLEWDTPIVKYLPDFKLKDAWITQNVTVVDILSHRVGLANHEAIWYGDTTNRDSAKDIYRNLEFLEFQSGFRDSFNYSNILYGVVGKLITTVSGMPFQDFLAKNIFEPLGMTNYT